MFGHEPGATQIRTAATRLACTGEFPPGDHPKIYLAFGNGNCVTCPYCGIVFRLDRPGECAVSQDDALFSFSRRTNLSTDVRSRIVTVFGASGFVGRHAVKALAKQGWRVRAVMRRPGRANYLLAAGEVGQIQLVKGNVNREQDVAGAVKGASAVVNLMGAPSGGGRQGLKSLNTRAAGRIARAAFDAGVSAFVHVSAMGADLEADTVFARSKWRGEHAVRKAFPRAVILQPSMVFGPEDKFFNGLASLARFAPFLPMPGGATKIQPVYVCDLAAAIARAASDSFASGRTYQLGGPKVYPLKDLVRYTLAETGRRRWLLPLPRFLAAGSMFRQTRQFKTDNVAHPGAFTLADLGIDAMSLEAVLPTYIWRFHSKGQFRKNPVKEVQLVAG